MQREAPGGASAVAARLWVFDLDDVLAVTSTCVRLSNGERITTADFRDRRRDVDLARDAFSEFSGYPELVREGPCAGMLRAVAVARGVVAVVTARSAPPSVIVEFLGKELGVAVDAENVYCVNSGEFEGRFSGARGLATADRKALAMRDLMSRFPGHSSLVYYDDDEENVLRIEEEFGRDLAVSAVHVGAL